jgi:hypothetical protein
VDDRGESDELMPCVITCDEDDDDDEDDEDEDDEDGVCDRAWDGGNA